jgi:ABC-type multidrug transport system fused ATPase/permease subunit
LRIQHLQQGLGGAKDVKLLGRESDFLNQYSIHNKESARVNQLNNTVQQLPRIWLELLAVCGLVALVLVMLAQGGALETIIPKLGLFAVVTFRLMPSISRLLNVMQSLKYCLPVIDVLQKDLILPAPEEQENKSTQSTFHKSLELQHITYTYPSADLPSLKDISLSIQCGESVGFIGTSGAGKSTLVDILLGLLPPDHGVVSVDGKDIQKNLRFWQNQIGYVPQSIYLTDDTLLRNIAFGLSSEQINQESVLKAIRAAHLDDFIQSLPEGLNTIVGERGVRLSGGQRQRIGIARALYHDPSVLVLDEATSALDTATEVGVMEAVRELHGSKTIIIVAHRLSTIEHCDRLYQLENGQIKTYGTPNDVL